MNTHAGTPLTITTKDMTFAALSWGADDAPVVLALHGWLDNAATFSRLAPQLEGVRVIAVDLAGHGLSDHRGAGADYPMWAYVADVIAIADALSLGKLHLLGHSMGGIVSMMTAATMPDRVASLTLIDGLWPAYGEPDQIVNQLSRAIAWRSLPSRREPSRFDSVEKAVQVRVLSGFGKISAQAAKIIVSRGLKEENGHWLWRSDRRLMGPTAMRMTMAQSQQLVDAVKVPALLVVAKGGMLDKAVELYADSLGHIAIHTLQGEHHLHLEEQAGDVAQVIQPHLYTVMNTASDQS